MDSSPRFPDQGSPRFTEHFGASPPYHVQNSPPAPQYSDTLHDKKDDSNFNNDMVERGYPTAGLESVRDQEAEKEVVYVEPQPAAQSWTNKSNGDERRICGLKRAWALLLMALIAVVVLGIGLGAGLGSGLNNNSSPSSNPTPNGTAPTNSTLPQKVQTQYLIGGSIDPDYYSKSGVFNGTGICLASESFSDDISVQSLGDIVIYFQYYDGSIRWTRLDTDGMWVGGGVTEVVAQNARNNTPLSTVSYSINSTSTWHVFYVDTAGYIRQKTNSNTTNLWVSGPINAANLKVNDQEQVGMQACWFGNDYGDSGYKHTPLPNSGPRTKSNPRVGMTMWYAVDNTTFHQWGWIDGDDEWTYQKEWTNLNGHAGVGCYTWGGTDTIYSMFVNQENAVEFWWRDSNTNLTNTTSHPIGLWTKAAYEIPDVHPSTGLGYTNFFYAQSSDGTINGYNITWAAENTTIEGAFFPVTTAIPGTRLTVTAVPTPDGTSNNIYVFMQQVGNEIVEYVRNLVAGQWTSTTIPIPSN